MDVVLLPERKKPNFLRATKEQLNILMAGFAVSDVSSQPHLEALKEATGLISPTKWIASWFTRQRKKVATASERVSIQQNAAIESCKDTTTISAMSVQEIAAFKTEHSEPHLSETLAASVDSEPEYKPVPSKKSTKKTRRPTKKRTSGRRHPPSSPLKPPFVSGPLPSRSPPSPSEPHSLEAQPQPADCASPTSTFILREMVPVAYKPRTSDSNDLSFPSTTAVDFSTNLLTARPTLATVSNAIMPLYPDASCHPQSTASLDTHRNPEAFSAEADAPHPGCVYPWQDPVPTESPHRGSSNKNNKTTVSQKHLERSLDASNALKPCASTSAQTNVAHIDRHLRPLLPLNSPYWNTISASHQCLHHYSQALLGMSQVPGDRNAKENRPISMYPQFPTPAPRPLYYKRSSDPRTLPPLFANTDLTITRARQSIQSTTNDAIPTSIATWTQTSEHSFVQTMTQSPELPTVENLDETRSDDQPGFLFDSTTAPLKYLDVLAPFPDQNLSMDEMMNRLLDPQLAVEDPFQAAMGLVFASQLGLSWDYS
ncbi:hypothetical protein C0995_015338 [Termitomyces sp. Mi166|nr:hypothetical protein C0995_015338 [Termitomyces sp. Mi166\